MKLSKGIGRIMSANIEWGAMASCQGDRCRLTLELENVSQRNLVSVVSQLAFDGIGGCADDGGFGSFA